MKLIIVKFPEKSQVVMFELDESTTERVQIGVLEVASISGIQYLDYEHVPNGEPVDVNSNSFELIVGSIAKAIMKNRW